MEKKIFKTTLILGAFLRRWHRCSLWSERLPLGGGPVPVPKSVMCAKPTACVGKMPGWRMETLTHPSYFSAYCRCSMYRGKSPTRTWAPGTRSFGSSGQRSRVSWWPIKSMVGPPLGLGSAVHTFLPVSKDMSLQ